MMTTQIVVLFARAICLIVVLIIAGLAADLKPAMAQLDQLNGSHDSQAPIEITADTLEVKQSENLAIFRGDVDAVQGDMVLKADLLVVHYRENNDVPDQPGISKIDVEGNVFVSSPNETAQGARGIYDVDNQKIWLSGGVILTQGDNIIQGGQLELDLASGKSKVTSAEPGSSNGERVHGLFVPKKNIN